MCVYNGRANVSLHQSFSDNECQDRHNSFVSFKNYLVFRLSWNNTMCSLISPYILFFRFLEEKRPTDNHRPPPSINGLFVSLHWPLRTLEFSLLLTWVPFVERQIRFPVETKRTVRKKQQHGIGRENAIIAIAPLIVLRLRPTA